jgi:hypothetical protein
MLPTKKESSLKRDREREWYSTQHEQNRRILIQHTAQKRKD